MSPGMEKSTPSLSKHTNKIKFFHWNKNTCILRMRWDPTLDLIAMNSVKIFGNICYDLRYWERLVSLKTMANTMSPERRAVIGLRPR